MSALVDTPETRLGWNIVQEAPQQVHSECKQLSRSRRNQQTNIQLNCNQSSPRQAPVSLGDDEERPRRGRSSRRPSQSQTSTSQPNTSTHKLLRPSKMSPLNTMMILFPTRLLLFILASLFLGPLLSSRGNYYLPALRSPLITSHAFNIDTQSAIVHSGPSGSYFGYTVAQHRDRNTYWLLAGAPKAQTGQPKVEHAGAVYKCSPTPSRACQQIPFDPNGHSTMLAGNKSVQNDDKSHQWFGGSLQSAWDNGSIIACAPRYVYYTANLKRRDPVGSCWISRGSFTGFLEYSPCRINGKFPASLVHQPALNQGSKEKLTRPLRNTPQPQTDQWGHHHLGSCQAGFASAISKVS